MNELLVFIQSLPEALKTGFIYSIMVMGVYITYKILDFPDMSVDATFPLGGFIFAAFSLSKNGFFGITNPFIGLILAVIGGMIAGYLTGALHVYLKINGLLSGILVMTGFYSINSRIVGVPNVFISSERNIFEIISYEKMNQLIDESNIIITHGGPATFMGVIAKGKIPIVVPRQKKFGEHVNDHQLEFCNKVKQYYPIIVINDIKKLLTNLRNDKSEVTINSNNKEFCRKLEERMGSL